MERRSASSSSSDSDVQRQPSPSRVVITPTTASSSTLNPHAPEYRPPPPAIVRPKYSHFISIPLAANPTQRQDLVEKLGNFKKTVLDGLPSGSAQGFRVIDESIFTEPETLHLTLLMLVLPDYDSITRAKKLMQSISSRVNETLENRPISVKLTGLACLMDTPAKAQVIHAEVSRDYERLLKVRELMVEAFKSDFVTNAEQQFKLHATMMNVQFRRRNKTKDDWFDARDLLDRYKKEEWGEYHIPEVHLSRRSRFENTRGYTYFPCCSSISLPAP